MATQYLIPIKRVWGGKVNKINKNKTTIRKKAKLLFLKETAAEEDHAQWHVAPVTFQNNRPCCRKGHAMFLDTTRAGGYRLGFFCNHCDKVGGLWLFFLFFLTGGGSVDNRFFICLQFFKQPETKTVETKTTKTAERWVCGIECNTDFCKQCVTQLLQK